MQWLINSVNAMLNTLAMFTFVESSYCRKDQLPVQQFVLYLTGILLNEKIRLTQDVTDLWAINIRLRYRKYNNRPIRFMYKKYKTQE